MTFKKLNLVEVAALNLGKENYFLAVGDGASCGIGRVQVYQSRDNDSLYVAELTVEVSASKTRFDYYKVDEATFDAVSNADDNGREDDDYYAGSDVRGVEAAYKCFLSILESN